MSGIKILANMLLFETLIMTPKPIENTQKKRSKGK